MKLIALPATAGSVSANVSDPQGRIYSGGFQYQSSDANGNQITYTGGVYTDTLGTTALTIAGVPPSNTTFSYTAPLASATPEYVVSYQSHTVKTNFGCGIAEYNTAGIYLVDKITLADGTFYQFGYEPTAGGGAGEVTGRLASILLPTGGTITYSYAMNGTHNGINCTDGSAPPPSGMTPSMTRTLSPGGTWKYSRTQVSGAHWQTTITDPTTAFNQTLVDFQGIYETERQVFAGTATGTPVTTAITCYNGVSISTPVNCPTTGVTSPIGRQTIFSYIPNPAPTSIESETDAQYYSSTYGFTSQSDNYDFGTGSVGALLRSVITTYSSFGTQILPSSVLVKNGVGSSLASTSYTYDQVTPAPTTGTPNHVAVTAPRGNLTTVGTQAAASSLYTRLTYYDTGMLKTASDPGLTSGGGANLTTYNYNNSGAPSPSCGNSFPTSISEPLSLSRSFTWNCDGGVMTSSTDENSKITSADYTTDPDFWRPDFTLDPMSNKTTFSYSGQTVAESNLSFNGGNSVSDIRTTLDGFGRIVLGQKAQTPALLKYDSAQTDYDVKGQVSRSTMPFQASPGITSATAPGVETVYDALGRPITVTDGGGGTASYTYTKNDVLQVVGPTQTFQKQFEYDGLGRIISVCEITTAVGGGACGQTVSQNGYLTLYTYDGLGNLLTVTQNAQAVTGHQTRTYAYDLMSRPTSEKNPETGNGGVNGTVFYTYDVACGSYAASPGNLTKRVDNAGNVTCYGYDALHRLKDAGNTTGTCRHYRYDAQTPPTGVTVSNTPGRQTEAYTDNCVSTKITDEWFGYDTDGRLTDFYESTPHSGGFYHTSTSYWANGVPAVLSGLTATSSAIFPAIYYGASTGTGLDGEGRITKVNAASGTNPVTGATYITSGTTEPIGALTGVTLGSADSDTFTYDPSTGRSKTYTFSVNGINDKGTLLWDANGTLKRLSIVDSLAGTTDSQICNYFYDDLGRLGGQNASGNSVDCGTKWQQQLSFDVFGNLKKSGSGSFLAMYTSTNQIILSGVTYDTNGNLLTDNVSNTYTWDPHWGNSATVNTTALIYDALGQMVEQQNGSTYTQILYSPLGKTAIMNGQTLAKAFINLPGGGTAIYNSTGLAYYRHTDWLGTSRLTSTASRTVFSDLAYAPFGEQYTTTGTSDASFTGQNSDTTSSLYDFMFREHSPSQGRWISPDPAGMAAVDPANPQTWNRYSYVMNNPLSFFDPLGLCGEDDGGDMDLITGTVTVIGYVPCICPPSMGYAFINGSLVCGPPANLAAILAAAQAAAGRGPQTTSQQ